MAVLSVAPGVARAVEDPDTEVAHRHFEQGSAFYEAADYERALAEFEAARRVKPLAAFDFNIGRCNDRLERWREAIDAYQRYVSSTPTPRDADEVRERIRVLEDRLAHAPPPKAERPPSETLLLQPSLTSEPEPAPPPKKSNKKTVAIVLGCIAGAVLIGGAIAVALLVKPADPTYTPSTLGIWPGTR